jgi:3-hydroxy-9,10-secoandrosta-1,3,5(10)-triene-9,17-dione monooxygenase
MSAARAEAPAIPAPDELVARAEALAEMIGEDAPSAANRRGVAPDVIAAIRNAGLFRILQPRRWGGFELDPWTFARVQIALARADMSVGWVYGVLGVHNFQMALFDDRAAEEVWGEDDGVLIASTFQPGGRAEPVPGGYRFQGRWKFSSGCDHVDWIFLGGTLDGEFLTCLVPRRDYAVVDAWQVMGLKATGSHDIVVEDIFVPEHRVHRSSDGFRCDSPGNKVNSGWLYRLPFHQVFIRAITNGCIGGLQAMLDEYLTYAQKRISVISGAPRDDPDAQWACGLARVTVDQQMALIERNFEALSVYAHRGEPPPFEERLRYKFQSSSAAHICLDAARQLFECAGGTGIYDNQRFGRIISDLTTAKQHAAAQHRVTGRSLGAHLLGKQADEWYL